ncbi:MAG: ATP-binding protein [Candidatus Brockarchaeota archaeon]|nr:ATP-binding protein [Candidatus Brockarchaeota archaeon]
MERGRIMDYFLEYMNIEQPWMIERELEIPADSGFIISIIGPRRSGKTYYLFQISRRLRNPIYLNFEDSRLRDVSYKEIRDLLRIFVEIFKTTPESLLLDEIQEVEGWEIAVRELHDAKKYRIFITGSSSKLSSGEIASRLRGRTLSFLLLPFSFKEFLKAKNIDVKPLMTMDEAAGIKALLREYLEFGGFPEVVLNEMKTKILKEYSDLILFRDFIERHKVRNIEIARFIHSFMLQNFSREVSIASLFNKAAGGGMKVAKDTVYSYVSNLEDTVSFFFLKKYSEKAHLRETWPKKIYLCDTGLSKTVRFHEDIGKLMENVIFLELKRRQNRNPLVEFFYWKDARQREVDFLLREGVEIKQLIQATYASSSEEIEKREVESLIKASEQLGCKKLLMITWDYDDRLKINGKIIECKPLWKWLLQTVY